MNNKYPGFYRDRFTFFTTEEKEFKEFIATLDLETAFEDISLKAISFVAPKKVGALTATDEKGKEIANWVGAIPENIHKDTIFNEMGVVIALPDGRRLCTRDYLWNAIKSHHRCNAPIMGDMVSNNHMDEAVDVLNLATKHLGKKNVLMMTRGGKVAGWYRMYNANATEMEQIGIMENALSARFPEWEFVSGQYTHTFTQLDYKLGKSMADAGDKSILQAYKNAWEDAGFSADDLEDMVPMVRLIFGESGVCSVSVMPYLMNGRDIQPLGTMMSVTHKGSDEVVWGRYEQNCDMVHAKYTEGVEQIAALCERVLEYPYSTMTHILKECVGVLPMATIREMRETAEMFYSPDEEVHCRAIELFNTLQGEANVCMAQTDNPTQKLRIFELLARVSGANWDNYDVKKPIKLPTLEPKPQKEDAWA